MTTEQQTLADVRKAIDELPASQREEVQNHAIWFRDTIAAEGPMAMLAFALVGAEMAAEE